MKGGEIMKTYMVKIDYGFIKSVFTVNARTKLGAKIKARKSSNGQKILGIHAYVFKEG